MPNDALTRLINEMKRPLDDLTIQFLNQLKARQLTLVSANFIFPKDPLSSHQPYFEFKYRDPNRPALQILTAEWAPNLEGELYSLRVKMASREEEAARGATLLKSNLEFSDVRFGESYTNSVLCELLNQQFGHIPMVVELLKELTWAPPSKGSAYPDARSYIDAAITGYGNSLVIQLGYEDKEAFGIKLGAVVLLLDIRFSITLRKLLFRGRK